MKQAIYLVEMRSYNAKTQNCEDVGEWSPLYAEKNKQQAEWDCEKFRMKNEYNINEEGYTTGFEYRVKEIELY